MLKCDGRSKIGDGIPYGTTPNIFGLEMDEKTFEDFYTSKVLSFSVSALARPA
jgi:hypothetical protein